MSISTFPFGRIVFAFGHGGADWAALRFATDFARLLRLDLLGLFVEDRSLAGAGEHAEVRQFRTLERQWQSIEGQNLLRDLDLSASIARRTFEEAATLAGIPPDFRLVRGAPAEALASLASASDIIVVPGPARAMARATQPFPEMLAVAMTSLASVLIVPSPIVREHGPVLAIARSPDDLSVASAGAIAAAANEPLETVMATDLAGRTPMRGPTEPRERIVVMAGEMGDIASPLVVAIRRGVPVLVVRQPR
jgi:hypothetical protein